MPEIPGYRVLRRIGRGGMSHVYLGVQVSLDRQVAIKVMSPEALTDEVSKQRFEGEARTIAKLEHPCIVGIHEVGRTPQGLMYYVLPYLAKGHLGQRDFTNDEPRAIEVLKSLLSALEYAHARGIVHRDVKAENVLFDNADRPLLTDFGIALSKRDTTRITTAGLALGSGGYMSPEQARGEAVDGRADLYSVGVLAHELITGRLPYLSSDPLALALMHAQDPIPRLPPEKKHWQPFIDRAMAKSPDNRFRNAQQMLSALLQIANKAPATGITGKGVAAVVAAPLQWRKPALIGALAVVGAGLLIAAFLQWRARQAEQEFYTAQPPAPTTPATTAPAPVPAPVTVAPAPVQADNEPPIAPPVAAPIEPAPVPVPVPVAATAAQFASVTATSTVTALDYDPSVPGAREIAWARRELKQNRLSTPPGDNAVDSLVAARRLAPTDPALPALADEVVDGLGKALTDAVAAGKDRNATAAYARTKKFATDTDRLKGKAWTGLRERLPPLLVARLEKATKAIDANAIAATKALAGVLEVPQALLEPAWTASANLPKPGQVVAADGGPATVLVNNGGSPLAFMREEVTRGEYARFVFATRRGAARCRNRMAPINIKKRNWTDPGFTQSESHPVVCVSQADATAYAQWLSNRTGEHYRLPTAAEWRRIASYRASDPCRAGHIDCGGNKGTAPAGQGPASPLGLFGVQGNAREWLGDGSGSKRLVAGMGWRDDARGAEPQRTSSFDADTGFDDVGIRLVRELGN
jgi:serine/threonine-protein kinase PpkA